MRKTQKKQIEDFLQLLEQAHMEIENAIENQSIEISLDLLGQCQQGVIQIGELIESAESEVCKTIPLLEKYCENVFRIHETIRTGQQIDAGKIYADLNRSLSQIVLSVNNDIKVRIEAVFLPYKASMWDSLESVWQAAMEDSDCDVYVVPIPYYDKNPDGTFKQEHYEGDMYPDYVDVVRYDAFDFNEHRPDMIFIHNPYDDCNYVTSIHPFFYSKNLKRFTECLVYIPYYSTTGGMSEAQRQCPAYYHADYIVMQAAKHRKFFDAALPDEKFLALGTPKFDKVITACKNPPEPPASWKGKMEGKKVYFYNTSLTGMLQNTDAFLKKMGYVFKCFMNREDACLLWRPHPLLESTFESMRVQYKPVYDALKKLFIEKELGIYDDTPDITNTIALSDAYIGDSGTSVTSLFGVAGKPLFILNNDINTAPRGEDWRGEIVKSPVVYGDNAWMITQGNKLYHAQKNDFDYEYFCDLNEYSGGYYYSQVITIGNKHYVCPASAQNILLLETEKGKRGVKKRIKLQDATNQPGAFCGAVCCGKYLFLIPYNYPAIIRYDTEKDEIRYFTENISVFIAMVNGERRLGGFCMMGEYLFIASPADNRMLAIHAETGKEQILTCSEEITDGCMILASDGIDLWMIPYSGTVITRWNPFSGETRQYDACLPELKCVNTYLGYECDERPFSWPAFDEEYVYLPPYWGNKFVRLNKHTGSIEEWKPALEMPEQGKNGYFISYSKSDFIGPTGSFFGKGYFFNSTLDRKLYDVNLESGEAKEIEVRFDVEELYAQTHGFAEVSEWLGYVCEENAFHSLADFLEGNMKGNSFDRESQMKSYHKITANVDGTSGENIYAFIRENVLK